MPVPKGSVVRRLMSDGSIKTELSKTPFRILYLAPAANETLATMAGSSAYHSVVSSAVIDSDVSLKMPFAGQAAGVWANILFDS